MRHAEAERWLPLYADDEMDPSTTTGMEAHLRVCEACGPRLEALRRNHVVLARALGREVAPAGLRERILGAIAAVEDAPIGRRALPAWTRYAATIVASAVLASAATLAVTRSKPVQPLAAMVFNDHMRALTSHRMIEVAAGDGRPIQSWFQGRLNFIPPVTERAREGLPLIGGRVDYIDGHAVAALVYGRGRHLVSLFVRPAPGGPPPRPASAERRGFNCVHWGAGGFEYWAVADVPATEMKQISRLLGNRSAA